MKMVILGSAHRSGTSKKTGNAYDFFEVSATSPGTYNNESGFMARTFLTNAETIRNVKYYPCLCDVSFGFNGRCEGISVLSNDISDTLTFFEGGA